MARVERSEGRYEVVSRVVVEDPRADVNRIAIGFEQVEKVGRGHLGHDQDPQVGSDDGADMARRRDTPDVGRVPRLNGYPPLGKAP